LARRESKYQLEENFQMQKKIIALAIAAAFSAPAFADTTVYGVVDAALTHVSADGQRSDMQVLSGGLAASRLGVKSVEDIGDMKAVVVLEYGLDTQIANGLTQTSLGTTMSARQQMLALAGGFGTFATGYLQTTGYDWAVKFDPMAGSVVSPLQSMTGQTNVVGSATVAARAQRALAYISPNMSGLTVAVNYSTDTGLYTGASGLGNLTLAEGAAETKMTAMLLSATYEAGPLAVGGVYAKTSNPSVDSKQDFKEYALGASYDLGVAKLFATYQNNKSDLALGAVTDYSSKAYSASVVAPVGSGAVAFSYAKDKISQAGSDSIGGSGYTLAYLQGLSKVTTMYVAVSKVSNDDGINIYSVGNNVLAPTLAAAVAAAPAAAGTLKTGGSSTLLAVGLNKKF
jgi:predicted porin